MISYLKNKFVIEKKIFYLYLIFWVVDLVFIEVSVNVLTKILTARQDSNFDSLLKQQISNDSTDSILWSRKNRYDSFKYENNYVCNHNFCGGNIDIN